MCGGSQNEYPSPKHNIKMCVCVEFNAPMSTELLVINFYHGHALALQDILHRLYRLRAIAFMHAYDGNHTICCCRLLLHGRAPALAPWSQPTRATATHAALVYISFGVSVSNSERLTPDMYNPRGPSVQIETHTHKQETRR